MPSDCCQEWVCQVHVDSNFEPAHYLGGADCSPWQCRRELPCRVHENSFYRASEALKRIRKMTQEHIDKSGCENVDCYSACLQDVEDILEGKDFI